MVVAVACALGCGGAPRAERVRLDGNRAIASGELVPGLASARDAGDPELAASDADRIRTAYQRLGYFAVQVTPRVERDRVVFAITEGRRAVARVELTGLPAELDPAVARRRIAIADGAPFDYAAYDAAKQPLEALVRDAGYAHAAITATATADGATAVLRYAIAAGPRCTFGAIALSGVDPSLEAAVRARLELAPGQPYSQRALADTEAELHDLGRFASVRLVAAVGRGTEIPVVVEVVEATRHELYAGGGLGIEPLTVEPRLRGGGLLVPAGHQLIALGADVRAAVTFPYALDAASARLRLRALGSIERLELVRPRVRGTLDGGWDYQTLEAFTWQGPHARLAVAAPLGARWLRVQLGWTIEHLRFTTGAALDGLGPDGRTHAARLGLDRARTVGAYEVSVVADLRDSALEPHRGVYVDLRAALGTPLALGDTRYTEVSPELRGYLSLAGVTVAARARLGALFGDPPATARYYSGGPSGQRGFSERQLARRVCAGSTCEVVGGAGLLETGVELRRALGQLWGLPPLGANLFLDGGDVTDTPGELDPGNLYWAVGGGLWSKLGDIKIRVDVGYRLNRTAPPDPLARGDRWWDQVAFHLGIGESY